MSLFAKSSDPDLWSTCSTPALRVWTQRSFFPALTSSGVMLPINASASAISFMALSELTRTSLTLLEADCQSAMVSALWAGNENLERLRPAKGDGKDAQGNPAGHGLHLLPEELYRNGYASASRLGEHLADDIASDIRQAKVSARAAVGQALVIKAQAM